MTIKPAASSLFSIPKPELRANLLIDWKDLGVSLQSLISQIELNLLLKFGFHKAKTIIYGKICALDSSATVPRIYPFDGTS